MTTPADWLDEHSANLLSDQANRMNTAKLIVTFSLGIGVALLVPALEPLEGAARGVDIAVFTVAVVLALVVFALDRLVPPNGTNLAIIDNDPTLTNAEKLAGFRLEMDAAVLENEVYLNVAKWVAGTQLFFCVASWGLSLAYLAGAGHGGPPLTVPTP